MAKKTQAPKEKPKEILELEKVYGIELEEEEGKKNYGIQNLYSTNKKGEVVSITLSHNNIKDISPLNILKEVEYINLDGNSIDNLSVLSANNHLNALYLRQNAITNIEDLAKFPNLKILLLSENPITDITALKYLPKLSILEIARTPVTDITVIETLKNLQLIYAYSSNINRLRDVFHSNNLGEVLLYENAINDISALENANNEISFELQSNQIKYISKKVAEKYDWLEGSLNYRYSANNKLSLAGNPIEFPPISVIELGRETVKKFYENDDQFGHAPLSEGRIIVIGDGSAGKSSLIEKVLYNTFTQGREQTNGIKIEHLHLPHPEDGRDLVFHIWDFGGQEIQHAVHKFFFTEGCLYVLVLDNRKEEEPDYWLQQIESLGGKAPVLVVFNKQDENAAEIADRKFLREKYPNIIGFYNTSCKTGYGITDFKNALETEVVKLQTVREQFPNNWLAIKKAIEAITTGSQHYLTYETYQAICQQNAVTTPDTQRLLLKYFNTIGAVTWFGEDVHLNMLHVLKPEWITQGVYKILTAKKTANLYGQINVSDFKELLQPVAKDDYTYDKKHYGYILSMMKKFDLCDAADDKHLLIPSAFGKEPKVEYSEFRGDDVRTYILQFKDYMPLALIHRFTAKKISEAWNSNYWYTGIVIKDVISTDTLAMVHADKEAKRLYVRIKGTDKLGMWGYIRRELAGITASYAKIPYNELVALGDSLDNTVNYDDLISHLQAGKPTYFQPGLRKDFNVGYLMGLFENKDDTIQKFEKGEIIINDREHGRLDKVPPIIVQILNNNNPVVNTNISNQVQIDIDVNIVNNVSSDVQGEANYLIEVLGKENEALTNALNQLVAFAEDAKLAKNSSEVKAKGWGRKLKNVLGVVANGADQLKKLQDGGEALQSMLHKLQELAQHVHLKDIGDFITNTFGS